jgi:transcriptional regulator with XRE-family HTH domain
MIEGLDGINYRTVRFAAGFATPGQLAERAGVGVEEVQKYERGQTESPETQANIEDALRAELAWERLKARFGHEESEAIRQLDASIRDGEMSESLARRRLIELMEAPNAR